MIDDPQIPLTSIHRIEADGVSTFYRQSGPADAPVVLLLHGCPTSSFQYRELTPRLADRYRVIAPDLPGFGFTTVPEERRYKYTFDSLAQTMLAFTNALNLSKYAMYVFDWLPLICLSDAASGASNGDRVAKWQRV
jgi:pimeloyl-ACP methyl ester carboxylesterase